MKKGIIVSLAVLASFASIAAQPQVRTLTIHESAEIFVKPDLCIVEIVVNTKDKDKTKAFEMNEEAMTKVKEVLKTNEIASDDMQTTRYEVKEEYRYDEYGNPIKQEGYQVKHVLEVKIRDFAIVIPLTDQALQAGATDIRDIQFTLEEPKNYMPELREKTLKAAEKKAAQMAEVAGFSLGKPVVISEFQPSDMPHFGAGGPAYDLYSLAGPAYGSLTLEPGEIELEYNIYITYELL